MNGLVAQETWAPGSNRGSRPRFIQQNSWPAPKDHLARRLRGAKRLGKRAPPRREASVVAAPYATSKAGSELDEVRRQNPGKKTAPPVGVVMPRSDSNAGTRGPNELRVRRQRHAHVQPVEPAHDVVRRPHPRQSWRRFWAIICRGHGGEERARLAGPLRVCQAGRGAGCRHFDQAHQAGRPGSRSAPSASTPHR